MAEEIVGRDEELARLGALIDAIPDGPRVLILEGDAGIGKTTLWRWAIQRASNASRRVLSCRPGERESKLSYAALGDLMRVADEATLESLPKPQRRALAVALLREDVTDPAVDPRALAYAFLTTLRRLASSAPILIAIDDAQWLDAPTSRLLRFAVRRLEADPVGVLVMARTGEIRSELLDRDNAFSTERVQRLRLEPLTLGAIHHVVLSRLGRRLPRSLLLQLHEVSQGNPFFALEIARSLKGRDADFEPGLRLPIPSSLTDSVSDRLARLPGRMQEVLLAVAASSQPTIAVVSAAVDHPHLVERDLEKAAEAGIIEIAGARVQFTHPLLAAAHYGAATPARRRALHKRLAAVVTGLEERAGHLAASATGPDATMAGELDRAAASARARGAPEVAATLFEEARRLTPPEQTRDLCQRTSEAAMCHYMGGQSARARLLWEEVVAKAPAGPLRAAALWRLCEFRDSSLDVKAQLEVAAAALEEAGPDLALRAAIHCALAFTLIWGGDVDGAGPHASAARDLAEEQSDPVALALSLHAAAWVDFLAGRGIPKALIDRTLTLEDHVLHLPLENNPRMGWAMMLAFVGEDVEAARRELTRLRRIAEDSGYEVSLPLLLYVMSELECRAGDWELAERYANECHEVAIQTDQEFRQPLALCVKAMLAARRGRTDVARTAAEEALSVATRVGPWYVEARIRAVLAFIEISVGSPDAAHRWLGPVVEREQAGGYAEPTSLHCLPDEIEALVALRDYAGAESLLVRLDEQGRRLNRAWALAAAGRCRGQLAAAQGDLHRAQSALEEAVAEHDRLPDPFELARTLLVQGTVRRRAREKRRAREALDRAAAIFADLGAATWAARTRDEVRRISARSPDPDQLSSTEQQVVALVAKGHTNREIARHLFVSVKTIEANLTRIYAKLGLRSRTELALRITGDEVNPELASPRSAR